MYNKYKNQLTLVIALNILVNFSALGMSINTVAELAAQGSSIAAAYILKKYNETTAEKISSDIEQKETSSNTPSFISPDYFPIDTNEPCKIEIVPRENFDSQIFYQNQDAPKEKHREQINKSAPSGSKGNNSDSDDEKDSSSSSDKKTNITVEDIAKKAIPTGAILEAAKPLKNQRQTSTAVTAAIPTVSQNTTKAFLQSNQVMDKIKKLPKVKRTLKELKKNLDGKLLSLEGNPVKLNFEHAAHGHINKDGSLTGMHFIPQYKRKQRIPIVLEKIKDKKFDNLTGNATAGIVNFKVDANTVKKVKPMSTYFDPKRSVKNHCKDIYEAWQDVLSKMEKKRQANEILPIRITNMTGISSTGVKIAFNGIDTKRWEIASFYPGLYEIIAGGVIGTAVQETQAYGNYTNQNEQSYSYPPKLYRESTYRSNPHQEQQDLEKYEQEQYYKELYSQEQSIQEKYDQEQYYREEQKASTLFDEISENENYESNYYDSDINQKTIQKLQSVLKQEMQSSTQEEYEHHPAHNPFRHDHIALQFKPVETSNVHRTPDGFEYRSQTAGDFGVNVHQGLQREAVASVNHALYAPMQIGGNFTTNTPNGLRVLEISCKEDWPLIEQCLQKCSLEEFNQLSFPLQESHLGQTRFNKLLAICNLEQYAALTYNLQIKPLALLRLNLLIENATTEEIALLSPHVREFDIVKTRELKISEKQAMKVPMAILSKIVSPIADELTRIRQERKNRAKEQQENTEHDTFGNNANETAYTTPDIRIRSMDNQLAHKEIYLESQKAEEELLRKMQAVSLENYLTYQEEIALGQEQLDPQEQAKPILAQQNLEPIQEIDPINPTLYKSLTTFEQICINQALEYSQQQNSLIQSAARKYMQTNNNQIANTMYNSNGRPVSYEDLPIDHQNIIDNMLTNEIGERRYNNLTYSEQSNAQQIMTQRWLTQPGAYQSYITKKTYYGLKQFAFGIRWAEEKLRQLPELLEQAKNLHAHEPEAKAFIEEENSFRIFQENFYRLNQPQAVASNPDEEYIISQLNSDPIYYDFQIMKSLIYLANIQNEYVKAQKAKEPWRCTIL